MSCFGNSIHLSCPLLTIGEFRHLRVATRGAAPRPCEPFYSASLHGTNLRSCEARPKLFGRGLCEHSGHTNKHQFIYQTSSSRYTQSNLACTNIDYCLSGRPDHQFIYYQNRTVCDRSSSLCCFLIDLPLIQDGRLPQNIPWCALLLRRALHSPRH